MSSETRNSRGRYKRALDIRATKDYDIVKAVIGDKEKQELEFFHNDFKAKIEALGGKKC